MEEKKNSKIIDYNYSIKSDAVRKSYYIFINPILFGIYQSIYNLLKLSKDFGPRIVICTGDTQLDISTLTI